MFRWALTLLTIGSFCLNVLFWGLLVIILSPFKAFPTVKEMILFLANSWIRVNVLIVKLFIGTDVRLHGMDLVPKDLKRSYLVTSNHQSWVDIFFLQMIFLDRIPFLRFFLKKELIWVPVLGLCWQALDFPFMKRYTREEIKKNPDLAGKDLETTKKFCEKFKDIPISVVNFVEGTRFTPEKHRKKNSPYKNLLPPKAGGLGFVLGALGPYLHQIIDVTIKYPGTQKSFLDFLSGKIKTIDIHIRTIPISNELIGDYQNDSHYKVNLQKFVNQMWEEKDQLI